MVTIKDIARALGISPSTVTRALAGNPRISAATIQRVRQQAGLMGYVADSAARAMQCGTSALVGLLVPDIENLFYASMARTVAQSCHAAGYQLVLSVTEDDPANEEQHIRALIGARCAGVLLVPTGGITDGSCRLLDKVPTVQLIRRTDKLASSSIGIDDRKALFAATGYLLDSGHRRIGLLAGDDSLDTSRARRRGFSDAHATHSLQPDPALTRLGVPRASHGRDAALALLAMAQPPSAILAAGAALTEGMLDAVSAHYGSARPAVSLLGFGDSAACRWWQGDGLSTITLPMPEIAQTAWERLLALIDNPAADPVEPTIISLDTGIVLRGSTRPPSD